MERGWQKLMEVNRVVFDPQQVSIEEIEGWLRQSGTYRRTLAPVLPKGEAP